MYRREREDHIRRETSKLEWWSMGLRVSGRQCPLVAKQLQIVQRFPKCPKTSNDSGVNTIYITIPATF